MQKQQRFRVTLEMDDYTVGMAQRLIEQALQNNGVKVTDVQPVMQEDPRQSTLWQGEATADTFTVRPDALN